MAQMSGYTTRNGNTRAQEFFNDFIDAPGDVDIVIYGGHITFDDEPDEQPAVVVEVDGKKYPFTIGEALIVVRLAEDMVHAFGDRAEGFPGLIEALRNSIDMAQRPGKLLS